MVCCMLFAHCSHSEILFSESIDLILNQLNLILRHEQQKASVQSVNTRLNTTWKIFFCLITSVIQSTSHLTQARPIFPVSKTNTLIQLWWNLSVLFCFVFAKLWEESHCYHTDYSITFLRELQMKHSSLLKTNKQTNLHAKL